ncbi:MAG: response regulator [Gemmataceae bacterium]|nr:response regulator [Gemmataceae bacterium]
MGVTRELVRELDAVGDWGLLTTDMDLRVTGWNRWLERHSGRPVSEIVGRPLLELFPDLSSRGFERYYSQALIGQTVVLSQRLHKHLIPIPLRASAAAAFAEMQQSCRILPLTDSNGICGTLTLIDDVTERVEYETALRARVEELREADRRKDEFLAMLAHELRNPLAPISNALHILKMTAPNEPSITGSQAMIERQVKHLVRLVDDLLDVSRVSRGKIQLQRIAIDLSTVAQQAVEMSRPLIDARRHRLTVEIPTEPVHVDGDFIRLAQVVSNLLNNAAKYTDEGGGIRLSVEASWETREAVIRVADNGRGIDPAALTSLFDLFFQVARTIDRAEGGLGIGLSLVKSIAEMHGGKVTATSRGRGYGAEFVVRLPLLPAQAAAVGKISPTAKKDAGGNLRVLVVDDNRDSATSMAAVLRLDGHELKTASDVVEAVTLAQTLKPDVVILDIGLPKLNGIEVCRQIRADGLSDALVIAATGYGQDVDREASTEAGFNLHLIKPVDLDRLRGAIREWGMRKSAGGKSS